MSKKTFTKIAAVALWALPFVAFAAAPAAPAVDLGIEYGAQTGLGGRDPREIVAQVINIALSLLGIVAVVIIIAGGFLWMTAGGNEENVDKARKMIFAGIIGLAIILSAYAIAKWVIERLVTVTTG